MKMFNDGEKESILIAKRNEVYSTAGIERSNPQQEIKTKIDQAYSGYSKSLEYVVSFMKATQDPKYVELARILKEIDSAYDCVGVDRKREEAYFVAQDKFKYVGFGAGKELRSTYKEFDQIRKRHEKMSKKMLSKLRKYKDVIKFYNSGAIRTLHTNLIGGYSENIYEMKDEVMENQAFAIINLDQQDSLSFVNTNKNLKRL